MHIMFIFHICLFCIDNIPHNEDSSTRICKAKQDNSSIWVNQEMLDAAYDFVCEGDLDRAFTKVGPSFD